MHTLIHPPPTLDTVIRSRLTALIAQRAPSALVAAKLAGWSESTLYRRTNLAGVEGGNYRRLYVSDVDEMLEGLDVDADRLLLPVVGDQDLALIKWVGTNTPADPMPSTATHDAAIAEFGEAVAGRVTALMHQGMLSVCGDPATPSTWYLRLTRLGRSHLAADLCGLDD